MKWHKSRPAIIYLSATFLVVMLPLLGPVLSGRDLSLYLQFPPRTIYVEHAPFSWPVFICLALLEACIYAAFFSLFFRCRSHISLLRPQMPLPWWARLSALGLVLSWLLAWSRFPLFAPLQPFTFIPIWFCYILLINGIVYAIKGRCLFTRDPKGFGLLFPLSTIFWWYFEYLNRFVQNWYYLGVQEFSGVTYAVAASISFSTVLPAVISTQELICSVPGLTRCLSEGPPIHVPALPAMAAVYGLLSLSALGLSLICIFPDQLFWLLWVSPLLIFTALDLLSGRDEIFSPLLRGDWSLVATAALAALICGFFWELWNWKSQAKWIYLIPYVGRFKLFEMPLVGYAGYLPFGLECWLIARVVLAHSGPGSRPEAGRVEKRC